VERAPLGEKTTERHRRRRYAPGKWQAAQ
jgi:hypothetical protein